MTIHRIGAKVYSQGAGKLPLTELIPVFHRWIQRHRLEDALIDVADYSHVHCGPGILLIAHEGNYGFDESDGRRGLTYYCKQPVDGGPDEALATAVRKTLAAAQLLATEPELVPGVTFSGNEIQLFFNDRLAAPNTDEAYHALEPAVRRLAARMFGADDYRLQRLTEDPRERLACRIVAGSAPDLSALGERLVA